MDTNIIRLNHFYDKRAYCKLQEYFGSLDYRRNYDDKIDEPYEDLMIIYHDFDEFSQQDEWTETYLIKDFLSVGIDNLSVNYINNFNAQINRRNLFTKELLDGFAKHYRNKLIEIKSKVKNVSFHTAGIKLRVLNQINLLDEYVESFFQNPYPNIKSKIRFNWNRTKLIYFFHLLRHNKQIDWIEDADLGVVIDNAFEYLDLKTGEFKPCTNTRKHLNAFKNNEGRPDGKANEDIKKTFTQDDFYNV